MFGEHRAELESKEHFDSFGDFCLKLFSPLLLSFRGPILQTAVASKMQLNSKTLLCISLLFLILFRSWVAAAATFLRQGDIFFLLWVDIT